MSYLELEELVLETATALVRANSAVVATIGREAELLLLDTSLVHVIFDLLICNC